MGDRCWTLHEGYPNVRENRSVSFSGTWDPANPSDYTPPFATMDFWLEWWLPAGYFGGNKVLAPVNTRFFLGHRGTRGVLNWLTCQGACGKQLSTGLRRPFLETPTRTVPRFTVIGPISFCVLEALTLPEIPVSMEHSGILYSITISNWRPSITILSHGSTLPRRALGNIRVRQRPIVWIGTSFEIMRVPL